MYHARNLWKMLDNHEIKKRILNFCHFNTVFWDILALVNDWPAVNIKLAIGQLNDLCSMRNKSLYQMTTCVHSQSYI